MLPLQDHHMFSHIRYQHQGLLSQFCMYLQFLTLLPPLHTRNSEADVINLRGCGEALSHFISHAHAVANLLFVVFCFDNEPTEFWCHNVTYTAVSALQAAMVLPLPQVLL